MTNWTLGQLGKTNPKRTQTNPKQTRRRARGGPIQTQSPHRQKLAETVKAQTKTEKEDITSARQRARAKLENINKIINNLLENITETNHDHVDRRLNELTTQKQQIDARLEELERLSLSQAKIDTIVNEGMQFLAGLEFTLNNGLPHEKLTSLRQCVEKIGINKPVGEIKLLIRTVPVGNLRAIQEIRISI